MNTPTTPAMVHEHRQSFIHANAEFETLISQAKEALFVADTAAQWLQEHDDGFLSGWVKLQQDRAEGVTRLSDDDVLAILHRIPGRP